MGKYRITAFFTHSLTCHWSPTGSATRRTPRSSSSITLRMASRVSSLSNRERSSHAASITFCIKFKGLVQHLDLEKTGLVPVKIREAAGNYRKKNNSCWNFYNFNSQEPEHVPLQNLYCPYTNRTHCACASPGANAPFSSGRTAPVEQLCTLYIQRQ